MSVSELTLFQVYLGVKVKPRWIRYDADDRETVERTTAARAVQRLSVH